MKPIVKVVCAIIWKDDKVFIARRKPEKSLGGYWEFPGGKLETDEDPKMGLKRELLEELGMKVKEIEYFGYNKYDYEVFTIELIAYSCLFVSADFNLIDHDDYAFIPSDEFGNYNLAPADIPFTEMLIY